MGSWIYRIFRLEPYVATCFKITHISDDNGSQQNEVEIDLIFVMKTLYAIYIAPIITLAAGMNMTRSRVHQCLTFYLNHPLMLY